jgi:aspartyl-tRNA(Asn)/glutamyl-tRNA(Gln) amidotransferase subunit C
MISQEEAQKIASLARIHLSEEESSVIAKDLEKILQYINKLEQLDISETQPTTHVLPLQNVFREDEVVPSLSQEDALSFSIAQKNGSFEVPKIIE